MFGFNIIQSDVPTESPAEACNPDSVTIVGDGTTMDGTLRLGEGDLCIEGCVQGDVITEGRVHVAEDGRVEGSVRATTLQVAGTVDGRLRATEQLVVRSSARVEGTIQTNDLEVQSGAVFSCSVFRLNDPSAPPLRESAEEQIPVEQSAGDSDPSSFQQGPPPAEMVDASDSLRELTRQVERENPPEESDDTNRSDVPTPEGSMSSTEETVEQSETVEAVESEESPEMKYGLSW